MTGKSSTRMNYEKPGWKSLVKKSRRGFNKIKGLPYKEAMIKIEKRAGCVIWITGLSGSGKTTLAKELYRVLSKQTSAITHLDGDVLREIFGTTATEQKYYERPQRLALAMSYARLCNLLSSQGLTVIISTISMFDEIYNWNRKNLPNYFEVYLKVPLDVLKSRDPKKLYQLFEKGKLKNVSGLDLPVDEPTSPDLLIGFQRNTTPAEIATAIMTKVQEKLT